MKRFVGLTALTLSLAGCQQAQQPEAVRTFTLPVLPDTQMYSRYRPAIFSTQTGWIAQHAQQLNAPMVLHLGDVVDRWSQPGEWQAADEAMKLLEQAKVPYSVLAGNHDVTNTSTWDHDRNPAEEPFLKWFGSERAKTQSTFLAADSTGFNQAHVFEAQGNQYLVLALDWRVSDETLAWANKVIKDHPTLPTILTSHQIMNIGPDMLNVKDTDHGLRLWEGLIRNNDQIFLTLNGHHHGAANTVRKNAYGHDVQMMVLDYQSDYEGGNAYMRLLEFDIAGGRLNVMSFSPWVPQKDKRALTQFDHAELKDSNNRFTWNIDFKERFAGFNQNFKMPAPATHSVLDWVRGELAGFREVPAPGMPAGSAEDYKQVAGTLAHWRFVGPTGQPAGDIADLSGHGNTLHRQFLNGAQPEDLLFSSSHSPLSAAQGSVCQSGIDSSEGEPTTFWQTAENAPLNAQAFPGGYTIETFIKLDQSFNSQKNGWMGVLARYGNGHDIPGDRYTDDRDEPLAVLDISTLQEAHWAVAPLQLPAPSTNELMTNWSWSLPTEQWVHLAVVNDAKTTRMFVDGAPVLRDADAKVLQQGIFSAGKPWLVGAKHYAGVISGSFNGCIGEVRMVDHALTPSEFLTARK